MQIANLNFQTELPVLTD